MRGIKVTLDKETVRRCVPLGPKDCAVLMAKEGLVLVDQPKGRMRIRLVKV